MSEQNQSLVFFASCFTMLVSCGGAAKEAEAPPEPPAPEPTMDATAPEPDMDPDEDAEQADEGSSEPASPEDFRAALQVVIQDDALQTAMNLTEPGRFPIKIAGRDIPSDVKLEAGTEAVEVVQEPEDPKTQPVLVFQKIEISPTRGSFKYRYDVEGIRGTSTVKNQNGVWELKASRISKY